MKLLINSIIFLILASYSGFAQTAVFNVSKDKDCNILKVTMDASASQGKGPLTYFWDFGNGNKTSGPKAIVDAIYVQPGNPVVSLVVVDADGNRSDTARRTLSVLTGPQINFDLSTNETCLGQTVKFNNKTVQGSSPITGYIWNVGNNITLTDKDPSYTFSATGVYDVTLVVTDANGCNVSLTKENLLSVSNSFQADFKADNTSGCSLPFSTQFHDLTNYSNISDHSFSFKWNFGDGTFSTEKNPLKEFSNPGFYDVEFTVTDLTTNCYSVKKIPSYIVLDLRKPSVTTSLIAKKCTEYNYSFRPNTEGLPAGILKTIEFGDGSGYTFKAGEVSVNHAYHRPGTYIIKTSYTNPLNPACSQTGIDSLVIPFTGEDFTASDVAGCKAPFTTRFSVQNISDAVSYEWNFGDGTTSADPAPEKVYTTDGTFTVSVKITGQSGCIYSLEKSSFIKIGPIQASFTSDARRIQELPNEYDRHPIADPEVLYGGCVPFTVNFTNTTVAPNATTFTWDYGDGTKEISSSPNMSHTYLEEGVYTPVLTATDAEGCTAVFSCKDCVKAGKPPVAQINMTGPDTVCCLYEKTFAASVTPGTYDFLWYNIILNDGGPSPGITQAYYRNSAGNWVLEDNTETLFPFEPKGLGLFYTQTSFSKPTGNQPDFYFYAYKNGCPAKIEKPKFQTHLLPWGTFAALPCDQEEQLSGGDVIDFNKVGGDWILGVNRDGSPMTLAKAVVEFEFVGTAGCTMPKVSKTFTPQELGFELDASAFKKIQQLGLFPKVQIPECAVRGDQLVSATFLFTHEDALFSYKNGKCACQEHWPYRIGARKKPRYNISARKGCAPLTVSFSSTEPGADFKYSFENGFVLANTAQHTFTEPGVYRFKTTSSGCQAGAFSDSIVVSKPEAKFTLNQNAFCLNNDTVNRENKTLVVTDNSVGRGSILKTWQWNFGNGTVINRNDAGPVSFTYSEKDVSRDSANLATVKLTVTDENGCQSFMEHKVVLRNTTASFSVKRTTGCYDSLLIVPVQLQSSLYGPFKGTFRLYRGSTKVLEKSLADVLKAPLILDTNGIYRMNLQINGDTLGTCISRFDTTVNVQYSSLLPDFKIPGKTKFSCVPSLVEVEDASSEFEGKKITDWSWKFTNRITGGEVTGTGKFPGQFALTDSGFYDLTLTVRDTLGCRKSVKKDSVIHVNELFGRIDSIPPALCPDETGLFVGASSNAHNYFWDFGDGIVASGLVVTHSYAVPGEKIISFIVTDTANCKRSYSGKVTVKKAPLFDLGKDTLLCERNSVIFKAPQDSGYVYSWSNGEAKSSIKVQEEGLYSLLVNDTILNCAYRDSVRVKISRLPSVSIDSVPPVCRLENITMNGRSNNLARRYEWLKDKKILSNSPVLNFNADGDSLVIFKVYNADNCVNSDSLTLRILERPRLVLVNQNVCPKDSFLLKPILTNPNPLFRWQWYYNNVAITKDTLQEKMVKEPGLYTVTYSKPNCVARAESKLDFHPLPETGNNPEIVNYCEEYETVDLDAGEAYTYYWYTEGQNQRFLKVNKTGTYIFRLGTEHNCFSNDTIEVITKCEPKVYVPNAFTPEIEGENKTHKIFTYNLGSFHLLVFNRWGEVIYETYDINKPWNGYYRNELMPSGVYPWIIKYSGNNPEQTHIRQLEGKVVLER